MPRKIKETTKDYLVNVPLPQHGGKYTVISHKSIMDYALAEIQKQGFAVVDEHYRATHDGQIAQGVYKLNYGKDPELSLMFAWSNSYNKQVRFRCVVGGYINENSTVMITGDMGNYSRKHIGSADKETTENMEAQLKQASKYYDMLFDAKESMKKITLSSRKKAELLGILFAEYNILTTEQASIIRQQMEKPTFFYAGGADSLWTFYNHATLALQQSHPRTWLEDQRLLHWFIESEFKLTQATPQVVQATLVPNVTPMSAENNYGEPENQLNLINEIENNPVDTLVPTAEEAEIIEQEMLTNDEIVDNLYSDSEEVAPVYDEDQIKERIAEDEAAVAEVCDSEPAGDEDHIDGVDELPEESNEELTVEDNVSDIPVIQAETVTTTNVEEDSFDLVSDEEDDDEDFTFDF